MKPVIFNSNDKSWLCCYTARTQQLPVEKEIKIRLISDALRKLHQSPDNLPHGTPGEAKKRTAKKHLAAGPGSGQNTSNEHINMPQNKIQLRIFVDSLCTQRANGPKVK